MSEQQEARRLIETARQLPAPQAIMQLTIAQAELMNAVFALHNKIDLLFKQHYDIAKAVGVDVGAPLEAGGDNDPA